MMEIDGEQVEEWVVKDLVDVYWRKLAKDLINKGYPYDVIKDAMIKAERIDGLWLIYGDYKGPTEATKHMW